MNAELRAGLELQIANAFLRKHERVICSAMLELSDAHDELVGRVGVLEDKVMKLEADAATVTTWGDLERRVTDVESHVTGLEDHGARTRADHADEHEVAASLAIRVAAIERRHDELARALGGEPGTADLGADGAGHSGKSARKGGQQ